MSNDTEVLDPADGSAPTYEPDDSYSAARIARVNLLPASVVVERRRRVIGLYSIAALAVFVMGLAALYLVQLGRVEDARAERDRKEVEVTVLRDQVGELAEYAELKATVDNRDLMLSTAMVNELSWARVLGDLALQFDRQSSLVGVSAATTEPDPTVPDEASAEAGGFDVGDPVASVEFTGYSVDRFAPGVEEVIRKFDDAIGFHDAYLSDAGEEERGSEVVTGFVGRVLVDERAYTHRYDEGLPQENER